MTITATVTQAKGLYCEESLHPKYAHLWTMFFNMVAVTIAMYCLIAFYLGVKEKLAPNKPFFKLLCIKLVIFFSFWQMVHSSCSSSIPQTYSQAFVDSSWPSYLRRCNQIYKIHVTRRYICGLQLTPHLFRNDNICYPPLICIHLERLW